MRKPVALSFALVAVTASAIAATAFSSRALSLPGPSRTGREGRSDQDQGVSPSTLSASAQERGIGGEVSREKGLTTERVVDGPPFSLTASDGSGLTLASLRASAVVEGPLAFTELRLAFDNPENRVREGTFKIVLPQGASIGRLAMKIGTEWQEGEVVPKQRARVAYEDALHHKQDPALMEKGAGNELTARVFPIPPRGRKEVIVSFAQELTAGTPYALPLRGLPQVGLLDVSVAGATSAPVTLHRERFTPTEDFALDVPSGTAAVRSGDLVAVRVRPVPEAIPDPITSAVVLVDTSASRALGLESELHTLKDVLHALAGRQGGPVSVTVAAFDQDVERVYRGDAAAFGDAEVEKLVARRALGASNLERALAWARGEVAESVAARVVLVTDGVATAGEQDASKLAVAATALKGAGATRLDVVAVGGIRDDALAHKLVTAGLVHDGVVADASGGVASVVRRLESGTKSDVAVVVEDAKWSYPTHLDGVQPGDEVLVYAELPEGAPLRVRVGGAEPTEIDASSVDHPLVERAWAQAKIASLEAQERDQGRSSELARQITALSTKHRVLSEYTPLLVLETDADYARFDIDRRALADILTVEDGKLAWFKRGERYGTALAAKSGGTPLSDEKELAAGRLAPKKDSAQGGTGTRAKGEEGAMGNPNDDGIARYAAMEAAPTAAFAPAPPAAAPVDLSNAAASASATSTNEEADALRMGIVGSMGGASQGAVAAPPASPAHHALGLSGVGEGGGGSGQGFGAGGLAVGNGRGNVDLPRNDVDPYTGKFKQVKDRLARHDENGALDAASAWESTSPGDVLALVALADASEATHDLKTASRAYGSIIDLFASRADLRRFAGERLEHLKDASALDLAIDTFDKARKDRPDHPASHRLAAFARVRRGEYAAAFDILENGVAQHYPEGRFRGVDRVLREDLGLVAAAWIKAEPARRGEILARLTKAGGSIEDGPSLRFVLNWETDANDVDFHIEDAQGGHAFYAQPHLASGGDLYADVTTGYGPECFTVRVPKAKRAGPYTLQAHYFSRGPMGYGMGKLEIIDHDGHGGLTFEERPFIVMTDHAFVDLGRAR